MYKLLRNFLFLFPPEFVHYACMNILQLVCRPAIGRRLVYACFGCSGPDLERRVFGRVFKNPVGLAAGFDKNARYLSSLECLGFGFVEIGTVTPKPQPGNSKPRLFRLKKDHALINRMGFNNEGADQVATRLRAWREWRKKQNFPGGLPMLIGGNIGKNKSTPNEEAWQDYAYCFRALHELVDYFVVNVSSPNTPGLRALQDKESLRKILVNLQDINRESGKTAKPILLKIAPDLEPEQIGELVSLAEEIALDGMVATNTTISRKALHMKQEKLEQIGAGGLSGRPLRKMSTDCIRLIQAGTKRKIPLIGSGGIFTADDALEKWAAGADLVQVWTGFIYEGPGITRKILRQTSH